DLPDRGGLRAGFARDSRFGRERPSGGGCGIRLAAATRAERPAHRIPGRRFRQGAGRRRESYEQALEDLRRAGAKLNAVKLPDFQAQPLRVILEAEAATAFDDLTRSGGVDQLRGQGPGDWPNSFRTSRLIPAVEYIRAQRARTLLMRKMDQFMADWD